MTDSLQTPALSGRDLARARRLEMSRTGGAKIKSGGRKPSATRAAAPVIAPVVASASASAASSAAPASAVLQTASADVADQPLTGKAFSMARRAMQAKGGKSAMPASSKRAGSNVAASQASAPVTAEQSEACCDACADENSTEPCAGDVSETTAAKTAAAKTAAELDGLCELIESDSGAAANASSSVRAYCRERRITLSQKGKLGLPGKAGRQARKSLVGSAAGSSLTGKALAKLHREDRCAVGRGDSSACRPSGRVRSGADDAPAKVEVGTTLSGQSVTGTQVEQTEKVTGAESGGCRSITGTEYLGVEQFSKFCSTVPQATAPKVGVSQTTHGQLMTGSSVAANDNVTGSEAGGCKSVTGSEYLGVDHFQSRCSTNKGSTQSVVPSQEKVIEGRTGKNMRITGADEARDNAVTGSESGSNQNVTGSDYVNMQTRTINAQAPAKVGVSHTASGMPVSGGESSRINGITGDEQDACGVVTGTEYVSSERFQSSCGAGPALTPPAKVGVDASRAGMTITGNLVDRDEKVTGNEPGTCQRVTGSQYDSSANKSFCGGDSQRRSGKVSEMHTLHGRPLTGTEVTHSPKLTGDDRGNCSVVTGTGYVSRESFQQSCAQQPVVGAEKTAMSRTWNDQMVSGTQPGHSEKVTGDETGMCKVITGSSYGARELASEFCNADAVAQGEQRLRTQPSSQAVSGITPGMDERLTGGFERGRCQSISGTPYQARGQQELSLCMQQARSMHHLTRAPANEALEQAVAPQVVAPAAEVYQADFTVMSPAKVAGQQRDRQRVHNSVLGMNNAITGATNKAQGVISGTPEFRHPQYEMTAAPVAPAAATEEVARERITGEGSEAGTKITGDDWSRGGLITGTEGMFSAARNQTQRGGEVVEHNKVGAFALRDRAPVEVNASKITGSSGGSSKKTSALVTLSGGACG